jgi:hypothetical protein
VVLRCARICDILKGNEIINALHFERHFLLSLTRRRKSDSKKSSSNSRPISKAKPL